ncbi:Murein L,D-transpeptidase YcbB/YkuD [Shimia aestuarii]|uniref:Murein L,D-transpeptidase YcbB/YkuD n=2 Tax=Shimia aestuarii TaxID=254406 RepID=A0A1I4LGA3_9RHOB|nr:Murein L,D-transpeptidase YcbB/YkuD [Shimia aestuarii]
MKGQGIMRTGVKRLAAAVLVSVAVMGFGGAMAGPVEREIEAMALALGSTAQSETGQREIETEAFVPRFYALRGFAPAWMAPDAAEALFRELELGVAQGFQEQDFRLAELRAFHERARERGAPEDIAAYEFLASDAAARLLSFVIFGKVDPTAFDKDWNFDRLVLQQDPAEVVNAYLANEGFGALMARVTLGAAQYRDLVTALARYREVAAAGGWPRVPSEHVLKPGDVAAAVEALRYRLAAEAALNAGQILPEAPATGEPAAWLYDANLQEDVKVFQARHGLEADGVIGEKTFQALNRTAAERVDQIRLSLERARWIMRDLGAEYVLVNIAGGRTYYIKGDDVWTTRSVTGSQYRQTPVFRDNIQYMEINPTWTVPRSIFLKDKLARIREDPGYLERGGYVVKNAEGQVIPAQTVNWAADNPGVTLMQTPGPKNALGRVKFMFPNKHAVYLHDTDNPALFQRNERNLSSGCVRLEHPFEFANFLMEGAPDWNGARLQAILDSGKTTRIDLPRPVPVLLTYWTAWVEAGTVQFREDLYGRDTAVLEALNR